MDTLKTNVLYYGDNLEILRKYIPDNSVDLIYLDPPFNSKKDYNILFKENGGVESEAQVKAFTDTWHWTQTAENTYHDIVTNAPLKVAQLIGALHDAIGQNDVMAYLVMMTARLIELHRVLKPTGSLYLHCDPTASHYLKLLMDAVFGAKHFVNEIIWHYRKWPSGKFTFQRNHDILLFYVHSETTKRVFNQLYMDRAPSTLKRFGTAKIISGHDETGRRIPSQMATEASTGVRQDDVWEIGRVPPIKQLFPTEKPLALLERIIEASSNKGDIVLDPFCGCGTAVVAAQELNRRWIGIDITHLAIALMRHRLKDSFGIDAEVVGEPVDLASAKALAHQDRYQFQWWALSLIKARPLGEKKKGADKGIDGVIYFIDDPTGKAKRAVVQVKSGHVGVNAIRELKAVAVHDALGIFITLEPPTTPMQTEAIGAGFYHSPIWNKDYPKIQILTIEELLHGKTVDMPPQTQTNVTFTKAQKIKSKEGEQLAME